MNFADVLWQVWLFYWFSAAFLGTLSAVFTAWGIRAIYRKIKFRHSIREYNQRVKHLWEVTPDQKEFNKKVEIIDKYKKGLDTSL